MKGSLIVSLTGWGVVFHVVHAVFDPVTKFRCLAGKQKPPESPLLTSDHLGRIRRGQYFGKIFAVSQPGTDSGKVTQVVDNIAEVHASDEHLAALRQLDATSQNLPGWVVSSHHFRAGVYVQKAQVYIVRIDLAKVLKYQLPQRADDIPTSTAQPQHQMIVINA